VGNVQEMFTICRYPLGNASRRLLENLFATPEGHLRQVRKLSKSIGDPPTKAYNVMETLRKILKNIANPLSPLCPGMFPAVFVG
jgi:hypothetical protein